VPAVNPLMAFGAEGINLFGKQRLSFRAMRLVAGSASAIFNRRMHVSERKLLVVMTGKAKFRVMQRQKFACVRLMRGMTRGA
jgi:hypothetical protein